MSKRPTEGELAILRVLWARGPSTVREVHETLSPDRPTGYTTTLKLLQIMADKGLVQRDEAKRAHVYEAREAETTQAQLVHDLVDRVFAGSAARLVMHAISGKRASKKELAEIRKALDEAEGRKR
jgi:predicted transcriptional regulator